VIIRVRPRGLHVRDVLRYLFGPSDQGEHEGQHLVAAWAGSTIGGVADLQPEAMPGGGFALGRLSGLLEQPVIAAVRAPPQPRGGRQMLGHERRLATAATTSGRPDLAMPLQHRPYS
jgi:hypothetical protein